MHHALYRKYRPKTFADVFGQKSITEALKNQIASGKVGHAYIFTGTRGTGKTTCAKIFARAVNCLDPQDGEPCGVCANCRGLEEGSILDVVEIDAASNNGVDDIRDLRDEAVYTPTNCKYKVYIVDEVHMLSTSAFNALLKIMEEPPSHVIFILATTEIHKVPATILSRCQRYDFGRIRPEIIEERLTIVANEENIPVTPEAKRLIAHLADGALRDALSILDTCASATEEAVDEPLVRRMAGVTDKSYLFSLSDAVKEQDAAKAILLVAELREKAIDMKRLCEELIHHYRSLMLAAANAADSTGAPDAALAERYKKEAAEIPLPVALNALRKLGDCLDRMGRGTDPRIELELCLVGLCTPQAAPVAAAPAVAKAASKAERVVAPPVADRPHWEQDVSSEEIAAAKPVKAAASVPEGVQPCSFWQQVIDLAQEQDNMVYGFIKNTRAYVQEKRVLIDGSPLFLSFMRANKDSAERIRRLIEQVTGEKYALGPYEKKKGAASTVDDKAEETFRMLRENGVPVEFK
ncbi:DNA polymerase III subunit gamma/tau [Pygmaiobacter massiliensis]|uniref:DNA polymerase III subunit gamma/tau n=1 Tax=Pygmaiobacter massiliensis TaxID=1917873 RepID=UPI000C7A6EB7|nr:DNA polymerase III subunit gamma/tau [Pygmaiobacter massiliensis]